MPSTLRRSPKKARETWIKAHDSAVESYGDGERAHRVAYAALKHSFEKVGDRWKPKSGKGPSDERAADPSAKKKKRGGTAGGVDAEASKAHLYERARELDVDGRSTMSKDELVVALQSANEKETRRARETSD